MTGVPASVPRPRRGGGLTLVEMVLAVTLASILLAGTASAILLASKALPGARSPSQQLLTSAQALTRMAAEMQYARALIACDSGVCQFIVPDRTGDDQDDEICYAWSGQEGDPLTRSLNGGQARIILESVQSLTFAYWKTLLDEHLLPGQTGGEVLLASYESASDLGTFSIKDSQYASQYFVPALPVDAVSWQVRRVRIRAKVSGGTTGVTQVQLRPPTPGGLPTSMVLTEHTMLESSLSSDFLWYEIAFSDCPDLLPGQGVCLVLQHVSDTESCKVQIRTRNAYSPSALFARSTNQGISWSDLPGQTLHYYIYGVVTTLGSQPQRQYLVDRISIALRTGDEAASVAQTSLQLPNRPEVTGP